MSTVFSNEQRQEYLRNGLVLVKTLFSADEVALLRTAIETDPQLQKCIYSRFDEDGLATRLATWNHPGESTYGLAARTARVVDTIEDMLGGEVYHYHSKLTAKEPQVGGAWEWHQDYGYWYHHGCIFPFMASVMVAIDSATSTNGCLQVIPGSHLCGRIEHGILQNEQVGADPSRVAELARRLGISHIEMEPGDGLFFHANVLHRSDRNQSSQRRWTLLFCYNAARNDPFVRHHHPNYTPLKKVPDGAILDVGVRFAVGEDQNFRKAPANPPLLTTRFAK